MSCQNGIKNLAFIKKLMDRKKVVFIMPSLSAGGSERVMSFVAQKLNKNKFDVRFIVLGFQKDTVFEVDSIDIQYLNKKSLSSSIITLFRILKNVSPCVIITSIGHLNLVMAAFSIFFLKIKFVAREASVITRMNDFSHLNSRFYSYLIKCFYPRLSLIICQSNDIRNDFIEKFKIKPSKLLLIHNPITFIPSPQFVNREENQLNFITIGRLSAEKGHLRILEVLSKIKSYNFHYTIIGSGPHLEIIKKQILMYDLIDKVSIISHTSKVLEELAKNDYFLQGSYVEGFPNALLESCTVGTPVIAFKAPGGTKEIIEVGINGFIIEDTGELFALLNDINKLRLINRDKVRKSVIHKFNSEFIIRQYENLLENI